MNTAKAMSIGVAAAILFYISLEETTSACPQPIETRRLDIEPDESDTTPPGKPVVEAVEIIRGEDTRGTLCISMGSLGFTIAPVEDDKTPNESLGYIVEIVEGSKPERILEYDLGVPVMEIDDVVWVTMSDNRFNPLEFTIHIAAVDAAGNQGEWSDLVEVSHPGMDPGCATTGRGTGINVVLLLVMGLVVAGRKKRNRCVAGS